MNTRIHKYRYRITAPKGYFKDIDDAGGSKFVYYTLDDLEAGNTILGNINIRVLARDEWTGLHDSKKVDLFEGDIVRFYDPRMAGDVTVYQVIWNTARLLFFRNFFDSREIEVIGKYQSYEIIGSTHTTPELLKGSK